MIRRKVASVSDTRYLNSCGEPERAPAENEATGHKSNKHALTS